MIAIRDTLPMHPDRVTRDTVVDFIIEMFHHMGSQDYLGEAISQGEHGIQCAIMADQLESKDTLTAAALLHDLGHFLHTRAEDCADHGIDAQHEDYGADFLARFYPPAVSEPVRLHVNAKRYLCAVEPDYFNRLSQASIRSLELQGGPLQGDALEAFAANPYRQDAVTLRRCDEGAKVPNLSLPDIETFRPLLIRVL
jgi:[1-hydroxy-2-(trimethylamino)ethyl]phosphonate dioxygenase